MGNNADNNLVSKMLRRREELAKVRFKIYDTEYKLVRYKIKDAFKSLDDHIFHTVKKEHTSPYYNWKENMELLLKKLKDDGFWVTREKNELFITWNKEYKKSKERVRKQIKDKKFIELDLENPIDRITYTSLVIQNKIKPNI